MAIQKHSKVDRARERLDRAVARLEASLSAREDSADGPSEVEIKLSREVASLKEENGMLRRIHDQVSSRIDNTIGRLKAVAGE